MNEASNQAQVNHETHCRCSKAYTKISQPSPWGDYLIALGESEKRLLTVLFELVALFYKAKSLQLQHGTVKFPATFKKKELPVLPNDGVNKQLY